VIRPLDIEHENELAGGLEGGTAIQLVSVGLNPFPEIVTIAPTGAALEERVIVGDGVVTVKVAVAKSPVLPVTEIV